MGNLVKNRLISNSQSSLTVIKIAEKKTALTGGLVNSFLISFIPVIIN